MLIKLVSMAIYYEKENKHLQNYELFSV